MPAASTRHPRAPEPTDEASSLLPVWRRIHQATVLRLSRHGLPASLAVALLRLHNNPDEAEPARLADQMLLPRQTMTFVLDALERKQLAHRKPHPVDRRRKIIVLTPKGCRTAQTILNDYHRYESEAAQATFSPQDFQAFRLAVNRLADALEHLNRAVPLR